VAERTNKMGARLCGQESRSPARGATAS